MPDIEWKQLTLLAEEASAPGSGPGAIPDVRWQLVSQTLQELIEAKAWTEVIRLRQLFSSLFARDTAWGMSELRELDDAAISAARKVADLPTLAHLLGARGHNLHREGRHREAIEAFSEASAISTIQGHAFEAIKSHFMTALCHRALGHLQIARSIVEQVLAQVSADNPWRGQPVQVMAWLVQDAGDLPKAEKLHREALQLHHLIPDSDILIAGTLADLAEVVGFQNRRDEAATIFQQSLHTLASHSGQYDRIEARTRLKYAEFLQRQAEYLSALTELDMADDLISRYGHYYDLLWRIELTRAVIFLKQKNFRASWRKIRSALRYRRQLGLSSVMLLRQLVNRALAGTGLPR